MADAFNNRGKTTFFGSDKGLKSLMKFEEKLKGTLLAMKMDGVVARTATANDFRDSLETLLAAWFEIFPNWPDAQAFAYEKISANKKQAAELIAALIGVRLS